MCLVGITSIFYVILISFQRAVLLNFEEVSYMVAPCSLPGIP